MWKEKEKEKKRRLVWILIDYIWLIIRSWRDRNAGPNRILIDSNRMFGRNGIFRRTRAGTVIRPYGEKPRKKKKRSWGMDWPWALRARGWGWGRRRWRGSGPVPPPPPTPSPRWGAGCGGSTWYPPPRRPSLGPLPRRSPTKPSPLGLTLPLESRSIGHRGCQRAGKEAEDARGRRGEDRGDVPWRRACLLFTLT